jgi:lysophospholipase L1-like esterase
LLSDTEIEVNIMLRHCLRNALSVCAIFLVIAFAYCLTASGQQVATPEKQQAFAIPATNDGLPGVGPIRRYDWFQKLWQTRRSQWAKDVGAVVFLGDSITQGWGNDMGGSFSGMKVANRGISGDTTRGMLLRLQEDVLAVKPAGVVMLMGTNDLEENATPEEVAENFGLIIEALNEHNPNMPIIVCQVFPSAAAKKRPAEKIKKVNELYADAIRNNSSVQFLDTWKLFANEKGDAKKEEFPDLLHPNQAGYAKWAAALRPLLATCEFLETDDDEFKIEDGFTSLFNGKDLSGWCYRPTSPQMLKSRERWKNHPDWPIVKERVEFGSDSKTSDGRYLAKHGRLIVAEAPGLRKIQQLWTTREFGTDFTLRLDFRAVPNADSGVFLRGKQLQCRDFSLAGPYKDLENFKPGDWNALEIVVTGNLARCTCNGEVLEEKFKIPDNGPIGIEGDRGQIEYRRIRIIATKE